MTSLQAAAERLRGGDLVGALSLLQGLTGASARLLRGIALAGLEELDESVRELEASVAVSEREGDAVLLSTCSLALAEVHLAARRLTAAEDLLDAARERMADDDSAARHDCLESLTARVRLLTGELDEAATSLDGLSPVADPGFETCLRELTFAELEERRFRPEAAGAHLQRAHEAAELSANARLQAVVSARRAALQRSVALLVTEGVERELSAGEVESLHRADASVLVVDGLRRRLLRRDDADRDFSHRKVPFDLLAALARKHPDGESGDALIAIAFEESAPNESHRSRLRVSLGRLRDLLPDDVGIAAKDGTWRLTHAPGTQLRLLLPLPGDRPHRLLALLSDGEAWSAADLATCSGRALRATQRDLSALVEEGLAAASGSARARRYRASGEPSGIASQLLLAGLLDPHRDSPHDASR